WPASTRTSAPAGTSAMRFSAVLISRGTPMTMRVQGSEFRVLGGGVAERRALCALHSALSVWSQPNHGLSFRRNELGGERRHVLRRHRIDRGQDLVQAAIPVMVEHEGRQ